MLVMRRESRFPPLDGGEEEREESELREGGLAIRDGELSREGKLRIVRDESPLRGEEAPSFARDRAGASLTLGEADPPDRGMEYSRTPLERDPGEEARSSERRTVEDEPSDGFVPEPGWVRTDPSPPPLEYSRMRRSIWPDPLLDAGESLRERMTEDPDPAASRRGAAEEPLDGREEISGLPFSRGSLLG